MKRTQDPVGGQAGSQVGGPVGSLQVEVIQGRGGDRTTRHVTQTPRQATYIKGTNIEIKPVKYNSSVTKDKKSSDNIPARKDSYNPKDKQPDAARPTILKSFSNSNLGHYRPTSSNVGQHRPSGNPRLTQHVFNGAARSKQSHEPGRGVQRQRSCVASFCRPQPQPPANMLAAPPFPRTKPALQLYRPPTLRAPEDASSRPGLNINAKEFAPLTPALRHSKSSSQVSRWKVPAKNGRSVAASPRVHFTDDSNSNDPDDKVGMMKAPPLLRSKSMGAADVGPGRGPGRTALAALKDLGTLEPELEKVLTTVGRDPQGAGASSVMGAVRGLLGRGLAAVGVASAVARYCAAVIEKEGSSEVFLETLLNSCQEYYQEYQRGALLDGQQWTAYMTLLHELYSQLKRLQRSSPSPSATSPTAQSAPARSAPAHLLLTLLAECCVGVLRQPQPPSVGQTETLFITLTTLGRDMEAALPSVMDRLMDAARDAVFASSERPAVRKTLMQLIEMSAASWQLPAPAVVYYYPTASGV